MLLNNNTTEHSTPSPKHLPHFYEVCSLRSQIHNLKPPKSKAHSYTMLNYFFPPPTERTAEVIAAETVTQSFMNTSCYVEMFRGTDATRREPMEFIFYSNLLMMKNRCPQYLHYHFSEDGSKLECFFMLVPNFDAHFTLYEKVINGGIPEFILRFGLSSITRLVKRSDWIDALEAETMVGRPRYYVLQRLIVEKSLQGKGVGSKYLNEALKQADQEQLPVFLGTQEMRNVTFYTRLGFVLKNEKTYVCADDPSYNYPTYVMIREPKAI